jgi:hypothetical protein
MKLLPAYICPHILVANLHVGITGKTHPDDVEQHRQTLIRYRHVHVLERNNIAEVVLGSVKVLCHGSSCLKH